MKTLTSGSRKLTYEKYNTENNESIVCFTQGAKMSRTNILTMINRNFGMWMTASSKNVQFIRIELFVTIHINKGRTIIKIYITS